jgi:uncharacterized protein YtpQ (UPF0354 family)
MVAAEGDGNVKRVVGVLLMVLGLLAEAFAQTLSPRAFTEEIANAARHAVPSATVWIERELAVEIKYANGQEVTAELTTSYNVYSKEPYRLKEIIDLHLQRIVTDERAKAQVRLDHSTIVPVVKNRKWLEDTERRIKASGINQIQLVDDFVDDLVVAYAEDTKTMFRYISRDEYRGKWESLRPLALENLRRLAPKIQIQGLTKDIALISAGDDYTSSLLVVNALWSSPERFKVKGNVVVAIPSRDTILVTGTANGKISEFRRHVAEVYAKEPHPLSQTILVHRNDRFTKLIGN